jgi:hypothetical protein
MNRTSVPKSQRASNWFADRSARELLVLAAEKGDVACINALLHCHHNLDITFTTVDHALSVAATQGHLEAVKTILPHVSKDMVRDMALFRAAGYGHLECLRELMKVLDPRSQDCRALAAAASRGQLACLQELLPHSDPMAGGCQALYQAADGHHARCVDVLWPLSDVTLLIDGIRRRHHQSSSTRFRAIEFLADRFTPFQRARLLAEFGAKSLPLVAGRHRAEEEKKSLQDVFSFQAVSPTKMVRL